jgi:hypothetical protein
MNIIRQREKLKEMHRANAITSRCLHMALAAPVFEWDPEVRKREMTEEDQQFVVENILNARSNVPTVGPFDCFRISRKECFDQWFRDEKAKGWALLRCSYAGDGTNDRNLPEHLVYVVYSWEESATWFYQGWIDGRPVPPQLFQEPDGSAKPVIADLITGFVKTLTYFLFETMYPGSVVLKVEPKQPGRSVEWKLARTHWLVLNQKTAQACQRQARGPTQGEIVRAAGWRRAHFRRLKAMRFTEAKRGKLVPVRKAWVGPLEWEGLDGKVYKVEHIGEGKAKL